MTRIRLALLLVALGLGVPVCLLAWRALEGLEVERAVRHQALAERAFDEMERVLSEWLAAEEARPFEHYRFYVAPQQRSPLSEPGDDFVIGAFQIDPDGSVHTPMQPRDQAAARARGDWPPSQERLDAIWRVVQIARETWKEDLARAAAVAEAEARQARARQAERRQAKAEEQERARRVEELRAERDEKVARAIEALTAGEPEAASPPAPARDPGLPQEQDPGTTRPLDGPLAGKLQELARLRSDLDEPDEEESPAVSIYSALRSLNRGADLRAERKQKVTEATIPKTYAAPEGFAAAEASPSPSEAGAGRRTAVAEEPAAAPEAPRRDVAERKLESPDRTDALVRARALGYVVSEEPETSLADAAPSASPDEARDDGSVRLALDPMVGRPVGDDVLLLYRTVLVGTRGYRQGLALDREKLARWLEARSLDPSGLSSLATLQFDVDDPVVDGDDSFVFQHRFAEPFDAVSARLSLVALPGVGSPGAIYALVAVLALVGAGGLWAVHRMVAVTVHFAERRSNFVSAVTHELKTPLTAIRMYAEMLRDGLVQGEDKKDEYYGTITDESERLSRLIDNVLEFSRLERGTREMSFHVGSPAPVVREAAQKLRAHAAKQGFSLEVDVAPELPPVRYDRDALLQVLFNLVDNAMKYAGKGDARRVVIEARERDGGVVLSVRDFGPGVARGHLPRIFEPFYRGEDELTRSTKGTGIGLALVRDLAERMGARVRGDNAPDGGFCVSLAFEPASR